MVENQLEENTDPCASKTLPQRYALAVLYHSTTGENWFSSYLWLSPYHECEWEGVVCNDESIMTSLLLGEYRGTPCFVSCFEI